MVKRTESGTTYTQNFDTENQLTSVVTGGQTTTFVYDGDGKLTKKVKPDGTSTLYLGIYELDLSSGGAMTKKTSYYPGGAMRVDVVGGTNTLYYMLKDHLGSASVLLDSTGNLVTNGEQRYYPFGENRITSADLKTDHLFTGQLSVGLGGIYSYGARFYSPRLGRFLSADMIVPNFADPQSLNRFTYVRNNPLKYIDPSGHTVICGVECEDDWFGTPTNPAPPPCVCAPPANPGSGTGNNGAGSGTGNSDDLDAGLPIPSGGGGGAPPPPGPSPDDGGGDIDDVGVEINHTGNIGPEIVIPFITTTYHLGQRYGITDTLGNGDLVGGALDGGYYSTYTSGVFSLSQGETNGLPWIRLAYLTNNGAGGFNYTYTEIGQGESAWLHNTLPYIEVGTGTSFSVSGGSATASLTVESYVRSQMHEAGAVVGGAVAIGAGFLLAGPGGGHAVACSMEPQLC